jgi:hypothetical protein
MSEATKQSSGAAQMIQATHASRNLRRLDVVCFGAFIERQRKQHARLHQIGRLFDDGRVFPRLNVLG